MNWLLLIVLAILIGNAFIGMKVGMIKTIFSLFSLIVSLTLTVWISPVVNDFMRGNEKFYGSIIEKVEKLVPFEEEETKVSEQVSIIEELPLPQSIKDALIENNNKEIYEALSVNNFRDYISNYIAGIIINALSFMITFGVILIGLWVLSIALDIVSKLPLLNQINKTAGLVAGLVHGLVVVWIFFILITVFGGTELGQKALGMISESQILNMLYNNNFLLRFITSAAKIFLLMF